MTSAPNSRRPHIIRLAVFAAFLVVLFYLLAVKHVVNIEDVRRGVKATGPLAPLTYIVLSAVLGAIFVPGPILAASSGLLFGPLLGVFVTLGATVGTAVVASLLGRRAGRDSARALLGAARADRVDALIQRQGLWAVVGQRLSPACRMRWPPTRSGRSEFRYGRWLLERSSVRCRGLSSTPRWALRSVIGHGCWPTRPSACGASPRLSARSPRGGVSGKWRGLTTEAAGIAHRVQLSHFGQFMAKFKKRPRACAAAVATSPRSLRDR